MKKSFASLFASMLKSVRRIIQGREISIAPPPFITPEQFQELFVQMMSDPDTRRSVLREAFLRLPLEGGACTSVTGPSASKTNYIAKWTSTACNLDNAVGLYEDTSGATTPGGFAPP